MQLRPSFAQGGSKPIGPPNGVMDMVVGPGKRYDPARDVLVFFGPMLGGMVSSLQEQSIPAVLAEFGADPKLERRVTTALFQLMLLLKENIGDTYDGLADRWCEAVNDPEAMDLLLKLMGRAVFQYYLECALIAKSDGGRAPCGMDELARQCLKAPLFETKRSPRHHWRHFKHLLACLRTDLWSITRRVFRLSSE